MARLSGSHEEVIQALGQPETMCWPAEAFVSFPKESCQMVATCVQRHLSPLGEG